MKIRISIITQNLFVSKGTTYEYSYFLLQRLIRFLVSKLLQASSTSSCFWQLGDEEKSPILIGTTTSSEKSLLVVKSKRVLVNDLSTWCTRSSASGNINPSSTPWWLFLDLWTITSSNWFAMSRPLSSSCSIALLPFEWWIFSIVLETLTDWGENERHGHAFYWKYMTLTSTSKYKNRCFL